MKQQPNIRSIDMMFLDDLLAMGVIDTASEVVESRA